MMTIANCKITLCVCVLTFQPTLLKESKNLGFLPVGDPTVGLLGVRDSGSRFSLRGEGSRGPVGQLTHALAHNECVET